MAQRLDVNKFSSIQLGLASEERILSWSYGEVTKPETINYKSQKPEKDGLFCEKIFGPVKDWECSCGKYKKVRYKGTVCERCGVEVISSQVRRDRLGHIQLASPVSHIWHLKGSLSPTLAVSPKQLEEVIYFVSHIVLNAGTSNILAYKEVLPEGEARNKFAAICAQIAKELPEGNAEKLKGEQYEAQLKNPSEPFEFHLFAHFIKKHTGAEFGIGAVAIQRLLEEIDIPKEIAAVKKTLKRKTADKSKPLKRLDALNAFKESGNKPEWMIVSALPVLPPNLRPMIQLDGGRFTTSDLNDLYRRVIIRNDRLKKLMNINAPAVILMNEMRMLQEAVDALIDNGRRNNKPVTGVGGRALKSLSHSLKGKQGRFRQNLLGKRVDYSGRSVIAVGPEMKMYECGLPRKMALQLFKPFVIAQLVEREIAPNIRTADKMCESLDQKIWSVVEDVIDGHPVLLNRAPTLHRLGIQAFMPKLVKGKAVRLHPLVTPAFNADFDGDQMAVHVPLSREAIAEAKVLMLGNTNILGPKDGKPIVTPSQDMVLGNYYLTQEEKGLQGEGMVFKNAKDAMTAYDSRIVALHAIVAIKASSYADKDFDKDGGYIVTTPGKIIFNNIFPEGFPYLNEAIDSNLVATPEGFFVPRGGNIKEAIAAHEPRLPFKKKFLSAIILEIFKRYPIEMTSEMLDKMKDLGFKFSTRAGVTVALTDIPRISFDDKFDDALKDEKEIKRLFNKGMLTNDERHAHVIKLWSKVKNEVQDEVYEDFAQNTKNPIFMMADSGARGNKSNFTQLAGMRGLMASPSGRIIETPVKSSFRKGISVAEFFISSHGSRKGAADTALKTAESGYLTRRLVDVAQNVTIKEDDCGSDTGFVVREITDTKTSAIIVPLYRRIEGRYTQRDVLNSKGKLIISANELISENIAAEIVAAGIESVEIRSTFTCTTKEGVCEKCYGKNLATGGKVLIGEAVGVIAAQSIGEPGTQLTMRTFHSGGVAGGTDITQGLPRVQELIEARSPKMKAVISEINGKVIKIEDAEGRYIVHVESEFEVRKYKTPFGVILRVKKGQSIEVGQKITDGPIAPKELLEVTDVIEVQRYMIKEIQKVFALQGIEISDKHIEVVIKQMLKKVAIVDGGDTSFISGALVDKSDFTAANKKALSKGKNPAYAKPVLLGITRASLATKSFLSAASFQETTRILREAAVKGKIDTLRGLKENVILGKMIPAGTGKKQFKKFVMDEYKKIEDAEAKA